MAAVENELAPLANSGQAAARLAEDVKVMRSQRKKMEQEARTGKAQEMKSRMEAMLIGVQQAIAAQNERGIAMDNDLKALDLAIYKGDKAFRKGVLKPGVFGTGYGMFDRARENLPEIGIDTPAKVKENVKIVAKQMGRDVAAKFPCGVPVPVSDVCGTLVIATGALPPPIYSGLCTRKSGDVTPKCALITSGYRVPLRASLSIIR